MPILSFRHLIYKISKYSTLTLRTHLCTEGERMTSGTPTNFLRPLKSPSSARAAWAFTSREANAFTSQSCPGKFESFFLYLYSGGWKNVFCVGWGTGLSLFFFLSGRRRGVRECLRLRVLHESTDRPVYTGLVAAEWFSVTTPQGFLQYCKL